MLFSRQLAAGERHNRLATAALIGVCLMLALVMAACLLSVAGIYERVLTPPAFVLRIGSVQFDTPCPALGISCDTSLPFYSIWRAMKTARSRLGRSLAFHPRRNILSML